MVKTQNGCIIGTGSFVPKRILTNKDLEEIVDTSDEWIIRRTGIKERHISSIQEKESSTDMATMASLKALDMAGVSPQSLDMIVVGTVTADRQFPSTACMVQSELKAVKATAFDVSAGCSGFLYALNVANNAIRCETAKNILIIGIERLSSVINWRDRGTCVLLADGAGAAVLSTTAEDEGILSTHTGSDGSLWELLYSAHGNDFKPGSLDDLDQKTEYLTMDGNRLFKKAIGLLSKISREALERNALSADDIKLMIPHQANIRIIWGLSKDLGIPMERVFTNIHKYGNTSSATVPIALDEANREGRLAKGDLVLLTAFGAGLTWASSVVRWAI